jgi:hypothetical protein
MDIQAREMKGKVKTKEDCSSKKKMENKQKREEGNPEG